MNLGLISEYIVLRETDIGYMIEDKTGEYFLHHNECVGRHLKDGEKISAFLYIDKMKRVAATLKKPFITIDEGGICEIVETGSAGVFINIGINRDILLSSDDLIDDKWPQIGDKLPCSLKTRAKNLFIRLLTKPEMLKLQDGTKLEVNQKYPAYIYRITEKGINAVDEHFNIIFIYFKNIRKAHRIGEEIDVKITNINEDDYSGTLIEQKEIMIDSDANIIVNYLENHGGVMRYTSSTSPDNIFKEFKMSKAAFKRALGNLYKKQIVSLEEDKTILINYIKK